MFKTYTELDNYIGEIPYGKIIELSGANNSYKTSCILSIIRSIQMNDNDALILYIDSDSHMRKEYLEDYGINKDRFVLSTISKPDDILFMVNEIVKQNINNVIVVIDTISNLDFYSAYTGINNFLIQLTKIICTQNIIVFAINQYRYNTANKKPVIFCSDCFNKYGSLRINIIRELESNELLLNILKNKFTGINNIPVKINIRKSNANRKS